MVNQPYIYQQPYSQPIIVTPVNPNCVVINQPLPTLSRPKFFSTYSTEVRCPFCFKKVDTNTEESFSICTCIYYFLILILLPLAIFSGNCGSCSCDCRCDCDCKCNCCNCNFCRSDCKCCFDYIHSCPNCGKVIGRYDSCKNLC